MNLIKTNSNVFYEMPFEKKSGNKLLSYSLLGIAFLLIFATTLVAQEPVVVEELPSEVILVEDPVIEDVKVKNDFIPDPSKSWKYSAILPGLGQGYNRSYWKIPIIYAGLGAVVYVYGFNNQQFHKWRNAYIGKIDESVPDQYPEASEHAVKNLMNTYRRYREYTILAGVVLYVFNILEAYVHAHLLNFDVGEDLSLRVEPNFEPIKNLDGFANNTFGLKFILKF